MMCQLNQVKDHNQLPITFSILQPGHGADVSSTVNRLATYTVLRPDLHSATKLGHEELAIG